MPGKKSSSGTNLKLARKAGAGKAEKIQTALYRIADAASAGMDMPEFYTALHGIVRELMYAENFYVTLYDPETKMISAPYFADEAGDVLPRPGRLEDDNKSLRGHVLHTGKTLHISREDIEAGRQQGVFEPMGTPSEDWIGVPLKIEGKTIGSLTIQSYKKGVRYTGQDVQLLEFVAQHIAVALTRARAIDETRHRNVELQIINSVQEGLVSRLDIQAIYELVGEKIRDTFNAHIVNIATYDPAMHLMHGRYFFEDSKVPPAITLPVFGFRKYVVENREPLVINENMAHWMEVYDNPVLYGVQPKSAIFVPMIAGNEAIGVISLQNIDQENAFSEADLRLLTTLANSMSVALENARLFDETQRLLKETEQRNAELAIINSVQESLASRLEMQEIYTLVGDKISEITGAEIVVINTWDPEKETTRYEYLREKGIRYGVIERPLTPLNRIVLPDLGRGKTIIWNEGVPERLERFQHSLPAGEMPLSVLIVPLKTGNRINTVISLQDTGRENAFDEATIRLVQTLAHSTGIALENARLWEQEELYRKSLQRELEIGREIQAGFLPEALPMVDDWEIVASLMSAREVAGDFYDIFELQDGNIGLVIADVCDKGVGAALFMTLFRSLIRVSANQEYFEQSEQAHRPYSAVERLKRSVLLTNNYIAEMHEPSGMFATLFFGILDPQNGKLSYINGGHEPPLILRSGLVRESLHKTGPAVGAIPNARFELRETHLQEGDLFFAFTDGVPDSRNPRGEFFGRDRLLDILHRRSASAQELVRNLESELRQYIGGGNPFDDITLLAVRRLGI